MYMKDTFSVKEFDIKKIAGLSQDEAALRLATEGFNEVPSAIKRSIFAITLEVVREPMFLLLIACGAVYVLLGDLKDAVMLMGFVFVIMGITFFQERKTERALEALRDLSSPRAMVLRDGREQRIPGREVVRDDILILKEGDRVPADAILLFCSGLMVDESLLTGESIAVRKVRCESLEEMQPPGGDDHPFVYSGTLIVKGHGVAQVKAVGLHSEIGKIGKSLSSIEQERPRLQKETGSLVRNLAYFGLFFCGFVVVFYGLTRGDWLTGFLAGITTAMAILPEEFPVVLTVFLALGAWRISQKRVLTRRVPAVETLGAATVLCVDKTGTLTQNRMSVSKMVVGGKIFNLSENGSESLPEHFHEIVEYGILAGQKDPFDPIEKALRELGKLTLLNTEHLHDDWQLIHEYLLSHELPAMSCVWKSKGNRGYVIAAKGAPEAVADLCHLDEERWKALTKEISLLAGAGLRVLGVARAFFVDASLPQGQHDFHFEFLGLLGFADPLRPEVADAIRECYDAGVRVVMITGDYPGTARNVANQISLTSEDIITGSELNKMNEAELQSRIGKVNIFARVVPEQKLQIVNALKATGEVVAMTGDGVNDAPALKAAHIGIAMGSRGTDVARESSALVLLDDDFHSIVQAIRTGRRIFDNLKKAVAYIFAVHVPIAGLSIVPVIMKWPLLFFPVHIVFLELIIDPACSIVFEAEAEEADVMKRPPRGVGERLFDATTIGMSILQGLVVFFAVLTVYVLAVYRGQGEEDARTVSFATLIIANLCLIMVNRSWTRTILETMRTPNAALWWVLSGAVFFLGLVIYVPVLRDLFRFSTLHAIDIGTAFLMGLAGILWFEGMKVVRKKKRMNYDRHV